jgi:hypothetical protein
VLIEVVEQVGKDTDPGAVEPPAPEAVVHGLPRPIAGRDIAPRCTGVQTPQDAIEELAMGLPRVASVAVVVEVREQVLDSVPLAIRKFIA